MTPYYADDAVTLYHADCREVFTALSAVDHCITDPPYSDWVHAKVRRGGSVHAADRADGGPKRPVISTSTILGFEALSDDLRNDVGRYLAASVRRWVLVFSDIESTGLWRESLKPLEYVRTGIWLKHGATPQFTGDRPASATEAITICHPKGRKRWNGGGGWAFWQHSVVRDSLRHPTQKPESLMADLVAEFTDPGEVIFDPFAGWGTTLVAAKRLGRKAVGVEMNEAHCEQAAKRLAQGVLPGLFQLDINEQSSYTDDSGHGSRSAAQDAENGPETSEN